MLILKFSNTCTARDGLLRSHDARTLKELGSNSRGLPCTVAGSRSTPHDTLQLVASDCMEKAITDIMGGGTLGNLLLNCDFLSEIGHFSTV
jgi:hypothetical protein